MAETTTTTTTTTKPEEMDETSERLIKTENYISKILSFIPTNLYVPPPEDKEAVKKKLGKKNLKLIII